MLFVCLYVFVFVFVCVYFSIQYLQMYVCVNFQMLGRAICISSGGGHFTKESVTQMSDTGGNKYQHMEFYCGRSKVEDRMKIC